MIASLVFLMGVVIRHYFNTRHARKGNPHWTWARGGDPLPLHHVAVDRAQAAGADQGELAVACGRAVFDMRRISRRSRDTVHGALLDVPCGRADL